MGFFKKIAVKPWLPTDQEAAQVESAGFTMPDKKVGLIVFMAVATSLFFLFFSAYHMRIDLTTDWVAIPEPPLLWVNTVVLVLCSIMFERAKAAGNSGDIKLMRSRFLIAGILTLVFLAGQLIVWLQMRNMGYTLQGNPSSGFFYLITGVHGVHILGGLVAWGRAALRMKTDEDLDAANISVDLCAIYWHFLLLVWLGIFALLMNT